LCIAAARFSLLLSHRCRGEFAAGQRFCFSSWLLHKAFCEKRAALAVTLVEGAGSAEAE
jgi:hypothetical protein